MIKKQLMISYVYQGSQQGSYSQVAIDIQYKKTLTAIGKAQIILHEIATAHNSCNTKTIIGDNIIIINSQEL